LIRERRQFTPKALSDNLASRRIHANPPHLDAPDLEDAAKAAVVLRRRAIAATMLVGLPALIYYLLACLTCLGDWMMGLAWCLPVGFARPVPWFYIVYFSILLVHRERRDNDMCLSKYGAAWETYCRKVPWRIIPGVY
jgi:Ergosterol biosynthesis ERG4/ERG24 family